MKIIKIFNNNVVLADQNSHQIVLIGKGLGFQKKPGMTIQSEKIEQIYAPTESKWFSLFNDLLKDISPEYLEIAAQIIHLAEAKLETKFNEYLLISLMDHIHFAVVRHQQQIDIHNEILWEVKHYYPTEFQVGQTAFACTQKVVNFIADSMHQHLSYNEQVYLTIHVQRIINDLTK
jgi:beta-glucoside operon transcriptional antiterminator